MAEQRLAIPLAESFDVAPAAAAGNAGDEVYPLSLEWRNVCYVVKETRNRQQVDKPILQSISGHAAPASFTTILGASGSGKTSLLSALADRLLLTKGATLTGEVIVNNRPAPDDYRARCAYVQQTDVFYPHATVRETVEMAARLRVGANVSRDAKKQRAEEVVQMLGLSKCFDTTVGDGNRIKGISGGEMKRLGIACELVSSPSLVMLDEPTSGLDSDAALKVVRCLNELALSGRTVIASIHQPGSPIYALFGNLVVLAEGRTAYFGQATAVIDHFSRIGYQCPKMYNPADYMLQITSIDYSTEQTENEARTTLQKIHANIGACPSPDSKMEMPLGPLTQTGASYGEQFVLLHRRIWRDAVRNKFATILKIIQSLVTTLIMVGLYSNIDASGVINVTVMNITALLFFVVITGLFGPLFGTIQAFSPEVNIVLRERMNNLYAMGPYYVAKLLVAIPFELIPLMIGNTVAFWALQLNHSASRYLVFLLFTCGMTLASVGIGFCLASVFAGNIQASSAAVGPIAIIFLLLGGFYINTATIPVWIAWLSKINYVNWAYRGLAINQFHDYTVTAGGVSKAGDDILADMFNNGKAVQDWEGEMWNQFTFICITIGVFNLLGYFALLAKGPKYLRMTKQVGSP